MNCHHLLRILMLARPIVASASAGFHPQHNKANVLAEIDAALASAGTETAGEEGGEESQTSNGEGR